MDLMKNLLIPKEGLDFLIKKAKKNDIILAAGSHLTVDEVKRFFSGIKPMNNSNSSMQT